MVKIKPETGGRRRLLAVFVGILIVAGGVTAGAAQAALVNKTANFGALWAYDDGGTVVAKISEGSNSRLVGKKGERQQIKVTQGDPLPRNGRAIYSKVAWQNNGYYCYLSGIGQYSASVACQNDWHPAGTTSEYNTNGYGGWSVKYHVHDRDGFNSSRGTLRVCEDAPLWFKDTCSGTRVVGADYRHN